MATWCSHAETSEKFMGEFRKSGTKGLQPLEESLTLSLALRIDVGTTHADLPLLSFGLPPASES